MRFNKRWRACINGRVAKSDKKVFFALGGREHRTSWTGDGISNEGVSKKQQIVFYMSKIIQNDPKNGELCELNETFMGQQLKTMEDNFFTTTD